VAAKTSPLKKVERVKLRFKKRTSIGGRMTPLNKHKRRSFKAYRGQGR